MSSVLIQDQNFDFNVGFIAKQKAGTSGNEADVDPAEYFPIDVGIISYLELEDNILDMGITGNISLKNPFQILDRVGALKSTEDTLYLDINIEDTGDPEKGSLDNKLSICGLIENSASISENLINNEIILKFEEAMTSMLKKTSLQRLNNPPMAEGNTLIGSYIYQILTEWQKVTKLDGEHVCEGTSANFEHGGRGGIRTFWKEVSDSIYLVLQRLTRHILIGDALPVLKIKNVKPVSAEDASMDRKFVFEQMFTDRHKEFLKTMIKGEGSGGDFSDVYLEEFTLSPNQATGKNASYVNTVERYDVLKADIENARDTLWGDWTLTTTDEDFTTKSEVDLKFDEIVSSFEDVDLGSNNSSIPVLMEAEKKLLEFQQEANTGGGTKIVIDGIFNKVKQSFLILNDSIIFTVAGRTFRKPGMFITVNGGDVLGSTPPDNIWFVISVKHIFKELVYENEVVAVRLFGNSKPYAEATGSSDDGGSGSGGSGDGGSVSAPGARASMIMEDGGSDITGRHDYFNSLPNDKRTSGRPGLHVSTYGQANDRTGDTNTRQRRGNSENLLRPGSVALSPSLRNRYNPPIGSAVYLNGQMMGYYEDSTPSSFEGVAYHDTIDIYDPYNEYRRNFKNAGTGSRITFGPPRAQIANPSPK